MHFAYPHVLWALVVLPPALVLFYWWAMRARQRLMTQFIQARLLPGLVYGASPVRQKIRITCMIIAVVCLILTLARPQWGFDWEETKQKGLDIVVAIDTSKSMLADDISPNRLARAKLAALDLMQQAKSDRLGLIAFAGGAFLQCPLTIDDTAFRQSIETLDVNTIPQGGTALGEAIRTALGAFKEGDNYKVLVLFTDGEDNDEGAVTAAEAAAKEGMRIFTVGIGTAEGELLRVMDGRGRTDYIRDEQGNVVKSHLNETLLQQIASATEGGFYLPLRGAKTMDTLYERGLAPLPKTEQSTRLVKRYHERYHWPLALGIVLLVVEMLLPERRRSRQRTGEPVKRSGAAVRATATVAVLLMSASGAWGSPAGALRDYQAGKYDEALKGYQRASEGKKDDPRLHYNAGAAAYRDEQFNEAAKEFGQALTAPDLKLQQQAYYNLGNTLYRLGENDSDAKKKQAAWEESLKQFEHAQKLSAQDTDAKFNYEFVKRKLEELKQQQEQQPDKDSDQQKDQKDQSKNQQQKQGQDKKSQDQKKDPKQDQQQAKDQQDKQQQGKDKSDQQKDQDQKKPGQDQKPDKQPGEKPDGQKDEQPSPEQAGMQPMTPQEARQLLDAQKGDEQFLQLKPPGKPENSRQPLKDW